MKIVIGKFKVYTSAIAKVYLLCLIVFLSLTSVVMYGEEPPCDAEYFFKLSISQKPTVHDVAERIRVAKGISPDRMAEFTGVHQQISYPGDSDEEEDDFRKDAYAQLRAEVRSAYAEVASTRAQEDEVQRSLGLYHQLVEISNTLYSTGKIDQAQDLQVQMQSARLSESLLLLKNREAIFSISMNVLVGSEPEQKIPAVVPLQEYMPAFDDRQLEESYTSLRFLANFQQIITPGSEAASAIANGEAPHAEFDVESVALVRSTHIQMDSMYLQLRSYRMDLIPRAEQAYATRLELYKNGKADFPMLLDSLTALSDMRKEYQSMLGEMHVMMSHLESVTAVSLDTPESMDNKISMDDKMEKPM
jgi:hypothetical protein